MSRQLCTFRLGPHLFGVDVAAVQEVLKPQHVTRIPLAPALVAGMINLRGLVVTTLDLRPRLDLPPAAPGAEFMNLVIRAEEGPVSLLVDAIGDVLEVAEEEFERPPETLQGNARTLITGAYKLKGRLLLLLDVQRAVAPEGVVAPSAGEPELTDEGGP